MAIDLVDWTTATQQPQKQLTTGAIAANNTANFSVATDSGAHAVVVIVTGANATLTVTGHQSGLLYINGTGGTQVPAAAPAAIYPAVDTQLDLVITAGVAGITYWVLEIFDVEAPLFAGQLAEAIPNPPAVSLASSLLVGGSLVVLPAGKPGDAIQTTTFDVTLAGNATSGLLADSANQRVYVQAWNVDVTTVGSTDVQLETTNNLSIAVVRTATTGYKGRNLFGASAAGLGAIGKGIQFRNLTATAAGNIAGEVVAVQR